MIILVFAINILLVFNRGKWRGVVTDIFLCTAIVKEIKVKIIMKI